MEYAALGQQASYGIAGAKSLQPSSPKTFDQIDHSVCDLQELNKRLESVLDRLGHCMPDTCEPNDQVPTRLGTDYSRSLNRLQSEVRDLRSNVSSLESHI